MKYKIKKSISFILIMTMLVMALPIRTAKANDVNETIGDKERQEEDRKSIEEQPEEQKEGGAVNEQLEEEEEEITNEQLEENSIIDEQEIIIDKQIEDGTNEDDNLENKEEITNENRDKIKDDQKQEKDSSIKIDYVYIESPIVKATNVQNIVIACESDLENIESLSLISSSEYGEVEWKCTNSVDNLYLFSKTFTDEEIGVYRLDKLKIKTFDSEILIDFKEIGITPGFEVIHSDIQMKNLELHSSDAVVEMDNPFQAQNAQNAITQAVGEYANNKQSIVIVLDPGHDGISPGAQHAGYGEEKLVLKIAKYCKEELEKYTGIKVYLTREDMSCPAGIGSDHYKRESECLQKRVDIAKQKNADMLISIHLNSSTAASAHGAEVYYPNSNWRPDIGKTGKEMAEKIQTELVKLGLYNRGIHEKTDYDPDDTYEDGSQEDYYGIIRRAKYAGIPGLIVEHAFISNDNELSQYLSNESGLKALGVADATAIANYFNLGEWVQSPSGKWYKYTDGSYPQNKFEYINNQWYYFNAWGYMQTGWKFINEHYYYFYPDGHMASNEKIDGYYVDRSGACVMPGWVHNSVGWWYRYEDMGYPAEKFEYINNQWYYFDETGYMQTGWVWVKDKCYYFYPDGHMASNEKIDGYYVDRSGACAIPGWVHNSAGWWYRYEDMGYPTDKFEYINSEWYYFDKTGYMQTGWVWVKDKCYYFYPDGHMASNEKVDGYYVDSSGACVVPGWVHNSVGWWYRYEDMGYPTDKFEYINDQWYYFDEIGYMVTGWKMIGNKWEFFEDNGAWNSSKTTEYYRIKGKSSLSRETMVRFYNANSPIKFPAEELKKGGTKNLEEFCDIILEESRAEGIKPEVIFAQIMKETGWLQFKGNVQIGQFNFAGLGVTGSGVHGADFSCYGRDGVRMGIRAQVQHMKAYADKDASIENLSNKCVDVRFSYVTPGSSEYVEWLGQKENPKGKGWATAKNYGPDLRNLIEKLMSFKR